MTPSKYDDVDGLYPGSDPWSDHLSAEYPADDVEAQRRMERRAARRQADRRSGAPGSEVSSRSPREESRTRLVAVAVLLAVAVIVALTMIAVSGGEEGGTVETVPVSLVPLTPEYLQDDGGGDDSTTTTAASIDPRVPGTGVGVAAGVARAPGGA